MVVRSLLLEEDTLKNVQFVAFNHGGMWTSYIAKTEALGDAVAEAGRMRPQLLSFVCGTAKWVRATPASPWSFQTDVHCREAPWLWSAHVPRF